MSVFTFEKIPQAHEITVDPPTLTEKWRASGIADPLYVTAYAQSATPAIANVALLGTLYRQDIQISEKGHKLFHVTVPYNSKPKNAGSYTWNFSTTGGTVGLKVSKETVASYKAAGVSTAIPNYGGAIGYNAEKKEVEGTEIVIPALKLNVTFKHPLGVVTIAKAKSLASYTGTTNEDTFLTFAPGELLFIGADGADGTDTEASVTYQFLASGNATNLTIGDITGIAKKGHHVIWMQFAKDVSESQPVAKPIYAYVERVYEEVNFANALGWS